MTVLAYLQKALLDWPQLSIYGRALDDNVTNFQIIVIWRFVDWARKSDKSKTYIEVF